MTFKKMARKRAREALVLLRLRDPYQHRRGTDQRWGLIANCLETTDKSAVDLGCNVGEFTKRCASHGLFALGLDRSAGSIKRALGTFQHENNLAFGLSSLTLSTIQLLPRFDVCLCLSVAHHWYREYGEDHYRRMIATLIANSGKLIFEPASIHSKYGTSCRLQFAENQEDSVKECFLLLLQELAGHQRTVRYLGSTPALGREQFRSMFMVT
jgi:hypothetical protein